MLEIRQLDASDARAYKSRLAEILMDCVAGGASIGFMSSVTMASTEAFFEKIAASVEGAERTLFGAFTEAGLVGTVQLVPAAMENQRHRADISKLLVHREARGAGVATELMQHAEEAARLAGKTLLVLDTCEGSAAERLYLRLGWKKAGVIPNYALMPDGSRCNTSIFWKQI